MPGDPGCDRDQGLVAQGRGQTVIEPRMHLKPDPAASRPLQRAARRHRRRGAALPGVKVVSDFVYNYEHGLPSEMAILTLFDPLTGMPVAILDAGGITDMRTGAVTAIGAKYLARKDSQACSAISARAALPTGTCGCWTGCSTSTRSACTPSGPRASAPSPAAVSADLGKPVRECDRLAGRDRGRGHRGGGVSPAGAGAAAADGVDQARRAGDAVRHHERAGTVADRRDGQAGGGRLGPGRRRPLRRACASTWTPASSPATRCMPRWGRSSPG